MKCREIKPGMVFDVPESGAVWKVLREGNYDESGGKRVIIDNRRKNKWWCQFKNETSPPCLLCFDEVFDNTKLWHFRWPKT